MILFIDGPKQYIRKSTPIYTEEYVVKYQPINKRNFFPPVYIPLIYKHSITIQKPQTPVQLWRLTTPSYSLWEGYKNNLSKKNTQEL